MRIASMKFVEGHYYAN